MHILVATSQDIKGCLAVNLAYNLLAARGHKLSVVLANDDPKTDGAKLCSSQTGPHESDLWTRELFPELESTALASRGTGAFRTWNELKASDDLEVVVLEKNKSINAKANMATVQAMNPDLIFSARFLHIFKEKIISLPRHGVLNMHPGALPTYKGLYVDLQAMRSGDDHCTMTLHRVDTGIDTGEVLGTTDVPVLGAEQSLMEMRVDLGNAGVRMMVEEVDRITEREQALTAGEFKPTNKGSTPLSSAAATLPSEEGNYYSWPHMDEYDDFAAKGLKLCHEKDIERLKFMFNPSLQQEMVLTMAHSRPKRQQQGMNQLGQIKRGTSLLVKSAKSMGNGRIGVAVGLGCLVTGMGTVEAFRGSSSAESR